MTNKIDLPMRRVEEIQKPNKMYQMNKNTEPESTRGLTKRALRILDVKYEKSDLPAIVQTYDHQDNNKTDKPIASFTQIWETFWWNLRQLEYQSC